MIRTNHYKILLLTLLGLLTLSGCQKSVLQTARDTTLNNLNGKVKLLSQKKYKATQKENGPNDFVMGKLLEHKEYVYDTEGMLHSERSYDRDSVLLDSYTNQYTSKGNVTTITSEKGTEEITRDLKSGTRTRKVMDPNGKVVETYKSKINDKGLPLETEVYGPNNRLIRKSVWERDVMGHVTVHEEFVADTLVYRVESTLNKSGDPTYEVELNATDTIATRAFLYNYDGKSNWVRRITRHMPKGGKPYYTLSERAISYY